MGNRPGGEREPQRLREASGDAGADEHGGPAGEDPLQALRAVQEEQAHRDGVPGRRQQELQPAGGVRGKKTGLWFLCHIIYHIYYYFIILLLS